MAETDGHAQLSSRLNVTWQTGTIICISLEMILIQFWILQMVLDIATILERTE